MGMIKALDKSTADYYLKQGQLTKFTPAVIKSAEKISGEDLYLALNIVEYLNKNHNPKIEKSRDYLEKQHQRRTAEQILTDEIGISHSCADSGVAFTAIARYKKIPTTYCQCVDIYSFAKQAPSPSGHVYSYIWVKGDLYCIDCTYGRLWKCKNDKNKLVEVSKLTFMIKAFEGLDPHDCGIKNHQDLLNSLNQSAIKHLERRVS